MSARKGLKGVKGSRLLLGCLILVLVAGAGAITLRKAIVEQAAAWWLAELEVPFSGLTVDRFDHRKITLTGVSLGPADVLSVGSVNVTYVLSDLVSGRIGSVRIDDLRIAIDLERNPRQLDEITALYRRARARLPSQTDAAAAAVPPIEVENGRISLTTGQGSADLRFRAVAGEETGDLAIEAELAAGRLDSPAAALEGIAGPISVAVGSDGGLALAFDVNIAEVALATDRPGPFAMKAALDASLDGDWSALDVSITLSAPETGVEMRADSRLTGLAGQPEGSLAIKGRPMPPARPGMPSTDLLAAAARFRSVSMARSGWTRRSPALPPCPINARWFGSTARGERLSFLSWFRPRQRRSPLTSRRRRTPSACTCSRARLSRSSHRTRCWPGCRRTRPTSSARRSHSISPTAPSGLSARRPEITPSDGRRH